MQRLLYQRCLKVLPGEEYRCIFDVSLRGGSYDVAVIYSEELLRDADAVSGTEREYLERFQEKLASGLDFPIRMAVGSRVERLEELSESARTVLLAEFLQRGIESGEQPEDAEWNADGGRIDRQKIDELVRAVETNQKESVRRNAEELYEELKRSDGRVIDMTVNYLFFRLLHLAAQADENIDQNEALHFIGDSVFEQIYLEEGGENLSLMMLDYSDYLVQLRRNQSQGVLERIAEDLKANYKENLTLKDMGRKYFINAAYLGQIFKKQFGESFKDYLNRVRIQKAEELLLHTDRKIYEIAEEVGYKDTDYFINKFIALRGCTPAKFRKQTR